MLYWCYQALTDVSEVLHPIEVGRHHSLPHLLAGDRRTLLSQDEGDVHHCYHTTMSENTITIVYYLCNMYCSAGTSL